MALPAIVKRTEIEHYMNTGTSSEPMWVRMGDGWTQLDDASSAQTESKKYINMDTEQTDTTSYNVSYNFNCDLMYADATIKKVYDIYKQRKVLSDCNVEMLTVERFNGDATSGYNAYLETLAVAPSGITESSNKMQIAGALNGQSDPTFGTFVPNSSGGGTFTPASA